MTFTSEIWFSIPSDTPKGVGIANEPEISGFWPADDKVK